MAIIGGIIAVFALILSYAIQDNVRKDTGVWVSRSNLRYIRRQARKRGLPEEQVFDEYMARKQKRLGVQGAVQSPVEVEPEKPQRFGKGWAIGIVVVIGILVLIGQSLSTSGSVTVVMVDRPSVNCRAEPTQESSLVKTFIQGASVGVSSEQKGWSQVEDSSCWVRSDLLKAF